MGDVITLEGEHQFTVLEKQEDGQALLTHMPFSELVSYLNEHSYVPLPPYIQKHRGEQPEDTQRHQTVFASDEKQRSAAAPCGLALYEALLEQLKTYGVQIEHVTLHVGAGTFCR